MSAREYPVTIDEDGRVPCPFCREDYNHVAKVVSERGPHADEADKPYSGTIMVEDARNAGRRAAARIDMWCECGGHLWSLILQQHKGTIYAYARLERTHDGSAADWQSLIDQWSTLPLAPPIPHAERGL
jgi:hypothetical protein